MVDAHNKLKEKATMKNKLCINNGPLEILGYIVSGGK